MVIFRENTEDIYAGMSTKADLSNLKDIRFYCERISTAIRKNAFRTKEKSRNSGASQE